MVGVLRPLKKYTPPIIRKRLSSSEGQIGPILHAAPQ